MKMLIGAVLLAVGIALVLMLRPTGNQERLIVRFPGAWILVGLLLTFWIGAAVSLIVTGFYG
jgi:hypothetical protein